MAKSVNSVFLLGRLTRDPEQRTTSSGKNVVSFSLAVDRGNDETDFFDVTAWDKLGELVVKYLSKGSKTIVQGRLRQDTWEKEGKKQSKISVVASDVTFIDSKQNEESKHVDIAPEDIDAKPLDLSEVSF